MESELAETLKQLLETGSEGTQQAIQWYARWYLTSAISWFFVGIAFFVIGVRLMRHKLSADSEYSDEWNAFGRYIIGGIIVVIAIVIVIFHMATIVAPEGYALHHLINDIKP